MSQNNSFFRFIEQKPLYYKEIDHERVHRAYALLKPHIKQPPTIHVVGTNGKGSTGRIMATLLHLSGKSIGHFSSPHIVKFNERIWIDNQEISDEALEVAHQKLYAILGKSVSDGLSYFEYTTLLAFVAMEHLDVIVLEAGLGGEFDATNVCSKELLVVTPIGLDHQAFLGESIAQIATTKINAMQKRCVVALQQEKEVYTVAKRIAKEKKAQLYRVEDFKEEYPKEYETIRDYTKELGWSEYLFENALTAIYALKKMALPYSLEDLKRVKLFGRFYQLLPNLIIDVGHNLLAAKAITKALKQKGHKESLVLIYNALNDKDYVNILKEFKPYIKRVEIIEIESERAVALEELKKALNTLEIEYNLFTQIEKNEQYLLFGSFYVVEAFLNKNKHNIKIH